MKEETEVRLAQMKLENQNLRIQETRKLKERWSAEKDTEIEAAKEEVVSYRNLLAERSAQPWPSKLVEWEASTPGVVSSILCGSMCCPLSAT